MRYNSRMIGRRGADVCPRRQGILDVREGREHWNGCGQAGQLRSIGELPERGSGEEQREGQANDGFDQRIHDHQ